MWEYLLPVKDKSTGAVEKKLFGPFSNAQMRDWASANALPAMLPVRRRFRADAFNSLLKEIYGDKLEALEEKLLRRCGGGGKTGAERAVRDAYVFVDSEAASFRPRKAIDFGMGIPYGDPFLCAIPTKYESALEG